MISHRGLAETGQLWFKWMIVTFLGGLVGWVVGFVCFKVANGILPAEISWVLAGMISGLVLGVVQWQFICPPVKGFDFWVLASAFGWVISLALTVYVLDMASSYLEVVVGSVLGGTAFGLAQGLAMRTDFEEKTHWFGRTVLGWNGALVLGFFLSEGRSLEAVHRTITLVVSYWATGAAVLSVYLSLLLLILFPEREEKDNTRHIRWWT